MIMGEVFADQVIEMPLAEDDKMVEALAVNHLDHPFDIRILVRRPMSKR